MVQYDEMVVAGIERACEKYPDKTALVYLGQRFSYMKFVELIRRFATALYDLGVRDNDKVMLYIPNCPQYLEFRDMLPKSKVGKLLRREVRDEERRRLGKEKQPIRV